MAAGIDDVALVAYGMKDVAALETMWDVREYEEKQRMYNNLHLSDYLYT